MSAWEKRKQYLVDKEFQLKFIIKVYLIVFISIIIVGSLLFFFNDKKLSFSAYQQVLSMKSARDMLLPTILSISVITAVVTLIVIIFRFMLETHRISGPVYRFGKEFESLGQGDLTTRTTLRKKDELKDLAEKFNSMVELLNAKVVRTKNIAHEIKNTYDDGKMKPENSEKLRKLINDLDDEISTLKTSN